MGERGVTHAGDVRTLLLAVALLPSALTSLSPAAEPPPLRVTATGQVSPFDLELLSIFARLHARSVISLDPSSRGPLAAVADGSADLAVVVLADEDLGTLAVTGEVLPTRLVAVTRRPGIRAPSIEALRRARIGILHGSRARAAVQAAKISGAELVDYNNAGQAHAALRDGVLTALLLELPDAFAVRQTDTDLEFGTFVGPKASLVYAVAPRDQSLAQDFDRFLASIRRTPSWGALLARSYGPEALEVLGRMWTSK